MYLAPTLLFAAFASLFFVPNFLDIPLGMLTMRELISQMMASMFTLLALALLARSIEFDPIWPWRPEFRRVVQRLMGRPR